MSKSVKAFVVAGLASGVGKTTVSLALMAALRKRRLTVQPFKCGPDFIDGGYHALACERPSRNLDGWMLSHEANQEIFYRNAAGADVCVVEGAMGLFDGVDGRSDAGSAAEIAKWLGLPVVLVVDASSIARSVAALVHGFETFDPNVRLAGVIFNEVAGPSHFRLLQDAVAGHCQAPVIGYLPKDERIHIPERYLGLYTAGEDFLKESGLELLAQLAEANIGIDQLLESVSTVSIPTLVRSGRMPPVVRIGVAHDRAFCFYYEDNVDALRQAGAEIVEFSPVSDSSLPEGIDALYFGGGYPELFAKQLAANHKMLSSAQKFAGEGKPIYAECGGLMYLAEKIVTLEGEGFSMARVLPLHVQMTDRLVNFGYADVSLTADSFIGQKGTRIRGHSFHCSTVTNVGPTECVYQVRYSLSGKEEAEGFRMNNVLASYIHLHFGSNAEIPLNFVREVSCTRERRSPVVSEKKS